MIIKIRWNRENVWHPNILSVNWIRAYFKVKYQNISFFLAACLVYIFKGKWFWCSVFSSANRYHYLFILWCLNGHTNILNKVEERGKRVNISDLFRNSFVFISFSLMMIHSQPTLINENNFLALFPLCSPFPFRLF